jgi:hypothetical protein
MQINTRSQDLHERIGGKAVLTFGFAAHTDRLPNKKASYADISMVMEKADWFLKAVGFRGMTPGEGSISGWKRGFLLPTCLDYTEGRNPRDRRPGVPWIAPTNIPNPG